MEDGWVDRGRLICPWHGSQFDVVLEAHADEEERDLVPPPALVDLSDAELVGRGARHLVG